MPTAIMTVLVLMLRIIYMYACVWYYVQISDGITQFEMWYMSWFSALSAVACGVSRVEWLWSFQQTERQASLAQAGEGPVPCCINGSAVPDWTGPSNKDKSSLQRCGCGGVGSCFGSQEEKKGLSFVPRISVNSFIMPAMLHSHPSIPVPPLSSHFFLSSLLLLLQSYAFQLCRLWGGDDTLLLPVIIKPGTVFKDNMYLYLFFMFLFLYMYKV